MEVVLFFLATFYFSGRIIYSAFQYNGALSWKIDEWMRKRDVGLQHNNIFKDGAAGILSDLDGAVGLPGELYIANKCQITFDQDGLIQTIYTFLYGKDKSGETCTYLVDYDAKKGRNMKVWIDGEANADYDENMRLAPMLRILERADYEQKVRTWSKGGDSKVYEILYLGRRSFQTAEGLTYIPGDADGDGIDRGAHNFEMLRAGGEIVGYEVSLHIPESEEVIPVRYMMEPEYISQDELNQAADRERTEEAKDAEGWTVDESDGSVYFFLDDSKGGGCRWLTQRLEVVSMCWKRRKTAVRHGNVSMMIRLRGRLALRKGWCSSMIISDSPGWPGRHSLIPSCMSPETVGKRSKRYSFLWIRLPGFRSMRRNMG